MIRGRATLVLAHLAIAVLGSCSSERQDIHTGTELEVRAALAQPVTRTDLSRVGGNAAPYVTPVTDYGELPDHRWYASIHEKDLYESSIGITLELANGHLVRALAAGVSRSHVGPEIKVTPLASGWIRVDERHLEDPVGFGAELELTTTDGVVISGTVTPADNYRPDAGPDAAP